MESGQAMTVRAETPPPPDVVIGLGNPWMGDDAVGMHVVAEVERRLPESGGPECLALGQAGFGVLHYLDGRRKAVLVDCARMDEAPGAWRRFLPHEAEAKAIRPGLSLHEGNLLGWLRLLAMSEHPPQEVVLIGIEPEALDPAEHLSPLLASRIGVYADAVMAEFPDTAWAAAADHA